jgi:rRNA maturation RNase YbeY
MIQFHTETNFNLRNEKRYSGWISQAILKMKKEEGDINYIFCDDAYLLKLNQEYLNHDTLTDIISFDYSDTDLISGDIFISVERVRENAKEFNVSFEKELQRVLIHGILHFAGFNDKTKAEKEEMRFQENLYIMLFK